MLLHRLYPTLTIIILMLVLLLPRPRSLLHYAGNDHAPVPFMAGFRTHDSLFTHRMLFMSSRCYNPVDQPHPLTVMLPRSTLYVSPFVGCSQDPCILCSCVTVCTRCDVWSMRILFLIQMISNTPCSGAPLNLPQIEHLRNGCQEHGTPPKTAVQHSNESASLQIM